MIDVRKQLKTNIVKWPDCGCGVFEGTLVHFHVTRRPIPQKEILNKDAMCKWMAHHLRGQC